MYPIAVIFVAKGQGFIAVNIPNRKAVSSGVLLLSSSSCKYCIIYYLSSDVISSRILFFVGGGIFTSIFESETGQVCSLFFTVFPLVDI